MIYFKNASFLLKQYVSEIAFRDSVQPTRYFGLPASSTSLLSSPSPPSPLTCQEHANDWTSNFFLLPSPSWLFGSERDGASVARCPVRSFLSWDVPGLPTSHARPSSLNTPLTPQAWAVDAPHDIVSAGGGRCDTFVLDASSCQCVTAKCNLYVAADGQFRLHCKVYPRLAVCVQ
jgi:hypothetical protein